MKVMVQLAWLSKDACMLFDCANWEDFTELSTATGRECRTQSR